MKIGVIPPVGIELTAGLPGLRALAGALEGEGVESAWVAEHVMMPGTPTTPYPYSSTGHVDPMVSLPDPLVQLTALAAVSSRLRLATGVLVLPLRSPVVLAKQLATLDAMSEGRLVLGVGIGWQRAEYETCNVDFNNRAARLEETIAALRVLWRGEPARFDGRFVSFLDTVCRPTPHEGRIPIVVGGGVLASARRAGRLGDGYYPIGLSGDELPHMLAIARDSALEANRDPDAIEVTFRTGRDERAIERFAEQGGHRAILALRGQTPAEIAAECRTFRKQIESVGAMA